MANNRIYQKYHQYYSYIQPILADPVVRSYFSLIASVILITFLIFFALSPTINIILGLRKKIADQKENLAALTTKINNLAAAQQGLSQVETSLPLLDQALPPTPSPEEILDRVHRSASGSGVTVSDFQFQTIALDNLEKGRQEINFSFLVTGNNQAVRQFLGNVENQLRYLRLKNLSINYTKSKGLETHIEAQGYFFVKDAQ